MADQIDTDAGLLGCAGPRGNQNPIGIQALDFFWSYLIVTANLDLYAQFTEILDEVIGKRIVVIQDEDHVRLPITTLQGHKSTETKPSRASGVKILPPPAGFYS